jgi:hypothetical protein
VPKSSREYEDTTVLWNQGVQADGEVLADRLDIIINNKENKICLLIEVLTFLARNVIQKAKKKLKYKNLSIKIQLIWKMICSVILGPQEL